MYKAIARLERTITGDVILHLIRPDDMIQIMPGNVFVSLQMRVDPWDPEDIE